MKAISAGLAMLAMLGVCACSPYVFAPEIEGFSTGVHALVSSYQTGRQSVASIDEQQRQAALIDQRQRLLLLPGCSQRDASGTPPKFPDCAIVPFGETAAPPPTEAEQLLANAAPAFDALKAYSDALEAITKAADEKTLNTATQSLANASSSLAGVVAKLDPAAKGAVAGIKPVAGIIGKGIAIYLDQRRYDALRSTVPDVDPAVQALGLTMTAALNDIRAHQLGWLEKQMTAMGEPLEMTTVRKLSPHDYQERLMSLNAIVSAFNSARISDPAKAVAAMQSAHSKLAEALRDGTGEQAAIFETIAGFVTAAETVDTATRAAAIAPPGGAKPARAPKTEAGAS